MKQNFRKAFNALEKIGCPVIEGWDDPNTFAINAEDNYPICWADYYVMTDGGGGSELDDFGVNNKINAILAANGLMAEWINTGVLGVYQD